jgi:PAS domain S-box-containing protein
MSRSIVEWTPLIGEGETGALMRVKDWSQTPLGPATSWSPALRMIVNFLLANRFPQLLWWGPEFCSIYNDAYVPILGAKHPWALGRPVSEVWNEIWHILRPLIETPFSGGPATWMEDIPLEINRKGFLEETHFTIAYSPVPDESVPGGIGGVLATVHEITEKVVGERRVRVLRDLGARSVEPKSAEDACSIVRETLATHSKDIPFLLVYLLDEKRQNARLGCCVGAERGDRACPELVDLSSRTGEVWPLSDVLAREDVQFVQDIKSRFDLVPPGPWSDPPISAAVLPIRSNIQHQLAGFMVAGLSSRLKFDDGYRDFLELMSTQIATTIANARAYEEERKRAESLAELDRAKTLFFSNISHEFRTPLTLLLGPLDEILSEGNLPPQYSGQLNMVHRNGLRLLKLVNTLLDFSRIEAGRLQVSYEPTDLAALTSDLASLFRSAVERAGMRLEVDCPPLSEPVYIDRDMWEKIVLNLLSNAFKYTLEGEIAVALKPSAGWVELSVRDTGIGINHDELPHIFERFHRTQNSQARTNEGSGIGLAFVQELVKLHGGSISVNSTPGGGSTFAVSIPLGIAHLPSDAIHAARHRVSRAHGATPFIEEALSWLPDRESSQPPSGSPAPRDVSATSRLAQDDGKASDSIIPRILLADDNADMRDYIQRLLRENYEVETVADGEAALERARQVVPDLILADVMMPRLDGFGLLQRLRADDALKSVPVILVSARAGEEARIEGLQAGADGYLVKPFSARELTARVAAHLAIARVRREAAETERALRAEAETERSRLRAAFIQTYAFMVFLSPDGTVLDGNRAAVEGLGFERRQVIGRKFWETWWSGLADETVAVKASLAKAAAGESVREECRFRMVDGSVRVADRTLTPVKDGNGKVQMIVATGLDMTEAKELRDGLETKVKERTSELEQAEASLRAVTGRLLHAQDEERRRIARELHDSAGQLLAALSMNLVPLETKLERLDPELGKGITDSVFLVDELSRQLRTLSHLLHPPLLDEAGLESALTWYVDGFADRSKIKVDFEYDRTIGRLPREMETAIFRLVQECLTNVHRHSGSASAIVRASRDPEAGSIRVEVRDQGRGISGGAMNSDGPAKPGIGIQGMRERVRQLGGQIEITSSDAGTTVLADFPVRAASSRPAFTT